MQRYRDKPLLLANSRGRALIRLTCSESRRNPASFALNKPYPRKDMSEAEISLNRLAYQIGHRVFGSLQKIPTEPITRASNFQSAEKYSHMDTCGRGRIVAMHESVRNDFPNCHHRIIVNHRRLRLICARRFAYTYTVSHELSCGDNLGWDRAIEGFNIAPARAIVAIIARTLHDRGWARRYWIPREQQGTC